MNNKCKCGHLYEEHNYDTITNLKFPEGKRLGDGRCLATMDCDCAKFIKEVKKMEVQEEDSMTNEEVNAREHGEIGNN